ncbi:MAG TPA: SprT family zinc-dependent metalloprotease [Pseudomonadota bacterium]|nr:SprT family zinc-dependent metalloprotease [Pseudomonadota bacterium]
MDRSQVHFGRTVIAYAIARGRRQKTVAIRVDATGGVIVRAPLDTPIATLDTIVHRKARWILERTRDHEDLPPPPSAREFTSGETFRYLGRQYRLKLERSDARDAEVRLALGHLIVPVPMSIPTPTTIDAADIARARLVAWYRERAQARIADRVATWAQKLNLHPASVQIRDQQKRWGSADARGNLRINWRIVQAPTRLIDYVIAHELIHLIHPDHTRDFWATLGHAMPDYEARREALRRLGAQIVW